MKKLAKERRIKEAKEKRKLYQEKLKKAQDEAEESAQPQTTEEMLFSQKKRVTNLLTSQTIFFLCNRKNKFCKNIFKSARFPFAS